MSEFQVGRRQRLDIYYFLYKYMQALVFHALNINTFRLFSGDFSRLPLPLGGLWHGPTFLVQGVLKAQWNGH